MDIEKILQLFTQQERIQAEFPGVRKDILAHLVRFVRMDYEMNFISYTDLDQSNADEAIAEQVAYFQGVNQSFSWSVYAYDSPADLKSRLIAHGFKAYQEMSLMTLELRDAPAALLAPPQADVRAITSREALEEVIKVEETVWGGNFEWLRKRLGDALQIPGYLNVFAAYVDNEPASVGWVFFSHQGEFASLYGGSTIEKFRQQGLYSAILAARTQAARARGYQFLSIYAGPMSRPIVEKHSFRLLTYAQDFEFNPSV